MKLNNKSILGLLFLGLFLNFNFNLGAQTLNPVQQVVNAVSNVTNTSAETAAVGPLAFHKGCFLLSLSEGSTRATYSTSNVRNPESPFIHASIMDGVRDPLFIEFGISNHLGIGLSSGNDLFTIDPAKYYGFKLSDNKNVDVKTSEFTFDINYHIYTTQKKDVSLYTSVGSFGVAFSGKDGDANYSYNAKGGIVRAGVKGRYYFCKRLGVLGMVSYYNGSASTKDVKGLTVGNNINTNIRGYALELGLCFRFF